jgi:hypothetical protein
MARQTDTSNAGSKALVVLAIALLIFWAGRDPAGALALIHRLAEGIANAASHAKSTKK